MAEVNSEGLMFNQYSVLTNLISQQQKQIDAQQDAILRQQAEINAILRDHESRLRRIETLVIIGFFVTALVGMVVYFVTR